MSKYKYLCFRCRHSAKLVPYGLSEARCPFCRQPLTGVGWRTPVPKKSNVKAWEALSRNERLIKSGRRLRASGTPFVPTPYVAKRKGQPKARTQWPQA